MVNKPSGITSFDVVYKIRKMLNVKKVGHSGTLDPLATGVLPIFFGKATKAISFLKNSDKEYVAHFKFGVKTDTGDITGRPLKKEKSDVLEKDLNKVLVKFIGKIPQIPPMYSAVKIKGVPLYKLARKGEVVERKERFVEIYSLKIVEFSEEKQEGRLKIFCSSGTYVRTLIEDIATKLDTYGTLLELNRTKASGFFLENCLKLEEIKNFNEEGRLDFFILPIEKIFGNLKRVNLNLKDQKRFLNGVLLSYFENVEEKELLCVYGDRFLGLAHKENGFLKIDFSLPG